MPSRELHFRDGFDWERVAWGKPDSPVRPLCSYCHGALSEVPLMLWKADGTTASLCDECVAQWVTSEVQSP
jgi:hypothetical protein